MEESSSCVVCGGEIKYYDSISRIVRRKGGEIEWIKVKRFRCTRCDAVRRDLPEFIFPYKQYDAEIIRGVIEGFITPETIGFEDYPCEATMCRWMSQGLHFLL